MKAWCCGPGSAPSWRWRRLPSRPATPAAAVGHAEAALDTPDSLGEARHPLANPAQLLLALGDAPRAPAGTAGRRGRVLAAGGRGASATSATWPRARTRRTPTTRCWPRAASARPATAERLVTGLAGYTERLATTPARIDYFATSLPTLLLFDEDLQHRQDLAVELLRAQLALLGRRPGRRHATPRQRPRRPTRATSSPSTLQPPSSRPGACRDLSSRCRSPTSCPRG